MSLGAALARLSRTRRTAIAATIAPARSTATIHGKPRSASRPPVRGGATTGTGCVGAAWIDVSRRLLPAICDGCTAGATTGGATSGVRTGVTLGGRSVRPGTGSVELRSEPARGTRPGREAGRRTRRKRSAAMRGAVGGDAAADVSDRHRELRRSNSHGGRRLGYLDRRRRLRRRRGNGSGRAARAAGGAGAGAGGAGGGRAAGGRGSVPGSGRLRGRAAAEARAQRAAEAARPGRRNRSDRSRRGCPDGRTAHRAPVCRSVLSIRPRRPRGQRLPSSLRSSRGGRASPHGRRASPPSRSSHSRRRSPRSSRRLRPAQGSPLRPLPPRRSLCAARLHTGLRRRRRARAPPPRQATSTRGRSAQEQGWRRRRLQRGGAWMSPCWLT